MMWNNPKSKSSMDENSQFMSKNKKKLEKLYEKYLPGRSLLLPKVEVMDLNSGPSGDSSVPPLSFPFRPGVADGNLRTNKSKAFYNSNFKLLGHKSMTELAPGRVKNEIRLPPIRQSQSTSSAGKFIPPKIGFNTRVPPMKVEGEDPKATSKKPLVPPLTYGPPALPMRARRSNKEMISEALRILDESRGVFFNAIMSFTQSAFNVTPSPSLETGLRKTLCGMIGKGEIIELRAMGPYDCAYRLAMKAVPEIDLTVSGVAVPSLKQHQWPNCRNLPRPINCNQSRTPGPERPRFKPPEVPRQNIPRKYGDMKDQTFGNRISSSQPSLVHTSKIDPRFNENFATRANLIGSLNKEAIQRPNTPQSPLSPRSPESSDEGSLRGFRRFKGDEEMLKIEVDPQDKKLKQFQELYDEESVPKVYGFASAAFQDRLHEEIFGQFGISDVRPPTFIVENNTREKMYINCEVDDY